MKSKSYYRVMLGKGSTHAKLCLEEGFVGLNYDIARDISGDLVDNWRDFNKRMIPEYMEVSSNPSKVSAGLACAMLWNLCRGAQTGDIVLSPDGKGNYLVGEITGGYHFVGGGVLPHRRSVRWLDFVVPRKSLSVALQRSTGASGSVISIKDYDDEMEALLKGTPKRAVIGEDDDVEDAFAFVMEKHLEDFLVANWENTTLGKDYNIIEGDGELLGQQYQTDAGIIDILAVSKDNTKLLVVELKRGRATDVVVGQTLRYIGFIQQELAEPNQTVSGAIVAFEKDDRLAWALHATPNIAFYQYQVDFKLVKG